MRELFSLITSQGRVQTGSKASANKIDKAHHMFALDHASDIVPNVCAQHSFGWRPTLSQMSLN